MKILQIANKVPYPPNDGGAIATLSLAKALSKNGHQVHILAINTVKHQVDPNSLPRELTSTINFTCTPMDTRVHPIKLLFNWAFSKKPYIAARFHGKNFQDKLTELLSSNTFDVVQVEGLYMCQYIPLIRKKSNALVAYRAHNIEHEIWERAARVQAWYSCKKWYLGSMVRRLKKMERDTLFLYDVLLPITQRDSDKLDQLGNNKPVHVIPTGMDIEHLPPPVKHEKSDHLFFLGALDWMPNQEGLLWFLDKVWPMILEKMPGMQFHVAGRNAPGWMEQKIKNIKNTGYHGEIPDAHDFILHHGLMVVPLFSGSGMRIKIVEGMALGKTIITTPIGIEGIPAIHGTHLLIAQNPNEFANSILNILANPGQLESIRENARAFIYKNFDNFALAKALADFYKSQLSE